MKYQKCPICDSHDIQFLSSHQDVEYHTSEKNYDYYQCQECKVIFLKDPPINELNIIYPDNYYAVEGPGTGNTIMNLLGKIKSKFDINSFSKALSKISENKIDCLDIGGGCGWIMNLVRQSDPRVSTTTILDINIKSESIAIANGHNFICGLADDLGIINSYNFVLMLNLIEHVQDPDLVLRKIFKSMRGGGILYIKTPNTDSLNRKIFRSKYWGGYHAPRHWVLFDKDNFSSLAKNTGFIIESFTYTQGAPQWAASILGSFSRDSSKKPMHENIKFSILLMLFACVDYLRVFFFKTDQMIFLLRKPY